MTGRIRVIDIFAGPGGLGEGFSGFEEARGRSPFRLEVSAEMEASAHATLRLRSFYRRLRASEGRMPAKYLEYLRTVALGRDEPPEEYFEAGPLAALWREAGAEAMNLTLGVPAHDEVLHSKVAAAKRTGDPLILIGGPPCQGYSVYNHGRGEHDPRAGLFREYLRLVAGLQPKWLVMENVTGLTSIAGGKLIEQIVSEIKAAGFDNVEFQILKAENYGVPQERRRIVFIANRLGLPVKFPAFSHDGKKIAFTTVWDAIGDLPAVSDQWKFENGAWYYGQPKTDFQKLIRKNTKIV